MFTTWSGKPISPNNVVRRWIVPACETLGLKRVSWLTLRRTYSSWAHEKGVPGKVIAQLMGHAKVDTTLNVYTQVVDGSLRRAADTVGSELFTIVHKPQVTNLGHRRRRPPERSEGKRYRAKNVRGQGTSAERFWLGALDDFLVDSGSRVKHEQFASISPSCSEPRFR